MIEVAVEVIEAVLHGMTNGVEFPESPLAEESRRVAGFLKFSGNGDFTRLQSLLVLIVGIAADPAVPHVQARHEHAAARGAHGGA